MTLPRPVYCKYRTVHGRVRAVLYVNLYVKTSVNLTNCITFSVTLDGNTVGLSLNFDEAMDELFLLYTNNCIDIYKFYLF